MHSGWVWTWVWGGTYISVTPFHRRVLKSGKTQTQSKQKKPIKLGLVRTSNHVYEFCCHAYIYQYQYYLVFFNLKDKRNKTKVIYLLLIIESLKLIEILFKFLMSWLYKFQQDVTIFISLTGAPLLLSIDIMRLTCSCTIHL